MRKRTKASRPATDRLKTLDDRITGTKNPPTDHKTHGIVLILYSFLTIIFTYPVAFSGDAIPGGGDAFFYVWDFWWFKQALLSLASPYNTPYLFHPTGLNLAFSAITPFNAILSIPLQMAFGLTRSYNLLCLLSFVLAGYGTYLLVKYLVGDGRAAFVSGLIFMFSPYHFAHLLGHMNLLAIEWIPFYALFLIRTVREGGIKNQALAALFLLLTTLCDYNYAVYAVAFTALYVAYSLATADRKQPWAPLKRAAVALAAFAVIVLPFVYPLFVELATSTSNYMYSGESDTYSADLLGFFLPPQFHTLAGGLVAPIYGRFTGNVAEYTVFAGYTALALSLIAILRARSRDVAFWSASALASFILCLGPRLHVDGVDTGIPLPFAILVHLPVISISRVPSRWDVLLMLSIAALAGYGIAYISKRIEGALVRPLSKRLALAGALSALILFEFLAVPFPMASMDVPQFYHGLANDPGQYAIYEIPDMGYHLSYPGYMYYQTVHGKELLTGYTHIPDYAMKFTSDTPFVKNLYLMSGNPGTIDRYGDITEQNTTGVGRSVLNYYGVRYVVLHENLMTKDQLDYANALLGAALNESPVEYKADSLLVYRVDAAPIKPFMAIGDNWYGLQESDGTLLRWMSNNGTVFVYSDREGNATLSFRTMSFYRPRTLDVCLNGRVVSGTAVSTDWATVNVTIPLKKGDNLLTFHTPEGTDIPSDIDPGLRDTRPLSMVFENVSLGV